jgi:nitrate/TMAO reductase-like tetraheme cytochrome c subunit
MSRAKLVGALLLLGSFVGGIVLLEHSGSSTSVASAATIDLTTSETCRGCHADVYAEWEASLHAQSYTDALVLAKEQSNNFRKPECIPCHAPAPVFEHGIGKLERVVERVTTREQGVDCLSCHRALDRVIGPAQLAASSAHAACRPDGRAELASPAVCAPCHNQHNTVDQWEESAWSKKGTTCLDCHMQAVERTNSDGTKRSGRSHAFPGAHDLGTLGKAFQDGWKTAVVDVAPGPDGKGGGKKLVVSLTNTGAGHNFPADARHRALDLVVTLIQPDGVEVPPREARPYGRERGTARRRFRNPYREETERITNRETYGRENTQILSGETLSLEVPFDPSAVDRARVELIYKLTPIQKDDEGVRLVDQRISL